MNIPWLSLAVAASLATAVNGQELLFEDDFKGALGEGWKWTRENAKAWRATPNGLEVHIEPGNMWGSQNNARNLLIRPVPELKEATLEASVIIENRPSNQYEQVNLVWYYDDSHMVKLGQELVDGKLCIVMGREEADKCRTIAIIPIEAYRVEVRLFATANSLRGQFRPAGTEAWKEVGHCTMPAPPGVGAKISLHFYQGPPAEQHWARVTGFRLKKHTSPVPQ